MASASALLVADVGRHVDENGRLLAAATRSPIVTARRDAASAEDVRAIAIGVAVAVALVAGSVCLSIFAG